MHIKRTIFLALVLVIVTIAGAQNIAVLNENNEDSIRIIITTINAKIDTLTHKQDSVCIVFPEFEKRINERISTINERMSTIKIRDYGIFGFIIVLLGLIAYSVAKKTAKKEVQAEVGRSIEIMAKEINLDIEKLSAESENIMKLKREIEKKLSELDIDIENAKKEIKQSSDKHLKMTNIYSQAFQETLENYTPEQKENISNIAQGIEYLAADEMTEHDLYIKGLYALFNNNFDEAIENFEKVIEKNVFHAQAYYGLAFVLNHQKEYKKAIENCKEAIDIRPDYAAAYIAYAYALIGLHKPKEAIDKCKIAIGFNHETASYFITLARAYNDTKRFIESITACNKAKELDPEDPEIYNKLAFAYAGNKQYDEALETCEEAINRGFESAVLYRNFAHIYNKKENYNNALEYCERSLTLDPKNPDTYLIQGLAYEKLGNNDKALESYNNMIDNNPTAKHYNTRGYFFKKSLGNIDKAIKDFEEALKLDPNSVKTYISLAYIYNDNSIKEYDKAISNATEALARDIKNANAYIVRATAYIEKEEWDDAMRDCNEAKHWDITNRHAYYYLGIIHEKKDEIDKAIEYFTVAIENTNVEDEDKIKRWFKRLAEAYLYQGEQKNIPPGRQRIYTHAVTNAKKAVDLSNGEIGLYTLARALAMRNDELDSAFNYLNRSLNKNIITKEEVCQDFAWQHLHNKEKFKEIIGECKEDINGDGHAENPKKVIDSNGDGVPD